MSSVRPHSYPILGRVNVTLIPSLFIQNKVIHSVNERYNELITDLREKTKELAKKIEAKVYVYGFLKL
jgi:hypothetical protein